MDCVSPWGHKELHTTARLSLSPARRHGTSLLLVSHSVTSDSSNPMDCSIPAFPVLHVIISCSKINVLKLWGEKRDKVSGLKMMGMGGEERR